MQQTVGTFSEPRKSPRMIVNLAAPLRFGGSSEREPAAIGNVSLGGLFVATKVSVKVGWTMQWQFNHVGLHACRGSGKIVWAGTGHGFGVHFDDLNNSMSRFLHTLFTVPAALRELYLADVVSPRLHLTGAAMA